MMAQYGPYGRTHGLRHGEFPRSPPASALSSRTRRCTSGPRPSPGSPPRYSWNPSGGCWPMAPDPRPGIW